MGEDAPARMQELDAALESIAHKLEAILTDSLKAPRHPKKDSRKFRKMLHKCYRQELGN
jgi:hypothetical protein